MEEISVKLYEMNGDVRRFPFQVPNGDGTASYQGIYAALLEKVKQVCPTADMPDLQLDWKDEDDDLIIMGTDDEVKEALRYRKGCIFRIFVRFRNVSQAPKMDTPTSVFIGDNVPLAGEQPRADKMEEKQQDKTPTETVHRGIVCDGCDQTGFQGIRYKCLVCRDFDLCGVCEGKRIHDQHPMIRISKPDDRSWMGAFMAAQGLNSFQLTGGRRGHCPFFAGRGSGHGSPHQATGGVSQGQEQQQHQQQEIPGTQFLRDVGQAVAAVLNGFGIDVDVDVEHDGQRTKVANPKKKDNKQEQKTEEVKQDAGTDTTVDHPMENIASPPPSETMVDKTPDGQQDWMILDTPDTAASQETPAAASASPTAVASSNPRIESAVAYMMSMGFTNEGGWLTQLLEAKDGDIAAVLELLHPSGKP